MALLGRPSNALTSIFMANTMWARGGRTLMLIGGRVKPAVSTGFTTRPSWTFKGFLAPSPEL